MLLWQLSNNERGLYNASEKLKDDKEVVMAAVSNQIHKEGDYPSLYHASEKLKADKEVIMAAVNKNGLALRYASDELKDDKEAVMTAISNNGVALQYASEKLKKEEEIVKTAISNNGAALLNVSDELKADKEMIIKSLNNKLLSSGKFLSVWKLAKKLFLQTITKFDADDVFIIQSIKTKGKNRFWVKCETWNFDGEEVYVFNRPNCFGTLESDDGDYTGLNEVIITCKKFKSISDAMQYKNLSYSDDRDSSEKNIFNYDDVLNNNFMIVGGFILHQKLV